MKHFFSKQGSFLLVCLVVALLLVGCRTKPLAIEPVLQGQELVGQAAKPLEARDWIQSVPLTIESLRGKAVLVVFWTGPNHPLSSSSISAFNRLYKKYKDNNFAALGLYYHESREPLKRKYVEALASKLRFEFPVAIDYEWKTLRSWWLDGESRDWMTVAFLLDKKGVIRYVRGGGLYVKGNEEYEELEEKLQELIAS